MYTVIPFNSDILVCEGFPWIYHQGVSVYPQPSLPPEYNDGVKDGPYGSGSE